jgi:hypothetical protein
MRRFALIRDGNVDRTETPAVDVFPYFFPYEKMNNDDN